MPNMNANIALIAIVSLALLFGCAGSGVPQEKYDSLSASCSKAKNDSAAALSDEASRTSLANARLSTCTGEKQSLETLLTVREQENEALRAEAAVLAKARAKIAIAEQYDLAEEYYLEAYGPGKLPNTVRLKKIDTQVDSLNDSALRSLWLNVKNCQGITDCDNAKAKFIPYIDGRITALKLEAAAIVGAGQ